ncbi:Rv3654c family TadE-like protein [Actinomyces urinae]|uniref:Rv3654c family TadE-like protein n=1 Tax=Actinomyces urinae TaxID=1689268 RepID=UPI000930E43C|nr:Rv3654c family TadE-like protein [Actinomyces urinae]
MKAANTAVLTRGGSQRVARGLSAAAQHWASKRSAHSEAGNATVRAIAVATALVMIAAVAALALGVLAAKTRAQAALDLATLAGASALIDSVGATYGTDPCAVVSQVCASNGIALTSCVADGLDVVTAARVRVSSYDVHVRSRAGPKNPQVISQVQFDH